MENVRSSKPMYDDWPYVLPYGERLEGNRAFREGAK